LDSPLYANSVSPNTDGTGFLLDTQITSPALRNMDATPTVLRIQPNEKAPRSGRTATRSTRVPIQRMISGMFRRAMSATVVARGLSIPLIMALMGTSSSASRYAHCVEPFVGLDPQHRRRCSHIA